MTKEDKELLLKDLCARLPYGIKVHIKGEYHKHHKVEEIDISNECVRYFENLHLYEEKIDDCLPYLRPMSSMTEEEYEELLERLPKYWSIDIDKFGLYFDIGDASYLDIDLFVDIIVWLNAHHFDYRGLIEKGLAIAVTKENNPYET